MVVFRSPIGLSTEIFQHVEMWWRLSLCIIANIPAVLWNVSPDVNSCGLVVPIHEMCHRMTAGLLTKTPAVFSVSWLGGICSGYVLILILRPLHVPDVLVRRGLKSHVLHFGSSSELFCLQHVFKVVSLFLRKIEPYLNDTFSETGKYLLGCGVVRCGILTPVFRSNLLPLCDNKRQAPQPRKRQSFNDTMFI
jgi:hypothetical protein